MAVSVKSYLHFESSNPEIRRFSVSQDVSSSYDYLVEKLRHVYPTLLRKDFILYWKDEEDELVAFSSDEELVIALGSSSEGSFRIYIKEKTNQDSTDGLGGETSTKHPGVVCDVCDKEIAGTRFKCLACPDYDLCSGCEGKGFHPEHEMLRIRTPTRHPWHGFWQMAFGPRGHHGGRGCHRKGRHGPMPHMPPFGPPCGPGGRGCFRGGFGSPPDRPRWGPSSCPRKGAEEKKACDEPQQSPENNEQSAPLYPSFEEVFTQVSQIAKQFMTPENFASWGFEQPTGDASQSSEQKDTLSQEKKSNQAEEEKKDTDDSPMPSESFVVVDEGSDVEKDSAKPKIQESVPQRRAEAEEFERRLNEAISQMETMGFDNDNGWLGQLLIAKDFDIGRVIDSLQPKRS